MDITLIISVIFIIALLILSKMKPSLKAEFPYSPKKHLMTQAESYFYGFLQEAVKDKKVIIFSKVRLWDIIYVSKGTENRKIYENKIRAKHIDFVICDSETTEPLLTVELDDKSHQKKDRQASDNFKDKALAASNIPILRVKVARNYDVKQLETMINKLLN